MFDIKENLKKLPDEPGVYIHRDRLGEIIYVGKAISLKKRVRQYFQSSKNMDPKVRAMVENIEEFEYIRCGSEVEALVLENNLIKKYMPRYNILLRDDKTYPYIKVTSEEWPRIVKTRKTEKDGGKYFGPYSDVGAVNQIVDLLSRVAVLKKCSAKDFGPGFRPCLNYHIGQCEGVCTGKADHEKYMQRVERCIEFLRGRQAPMIAYLKEEMMAASDRMEYEKAAEYRDYITACQALSEKQRVVLHSTEDADIVINGGKGNIILFTVRDGKLSGRETFSMNTDMRMTDVSAEMPEGDGAGDACTAEEADRNSVTEAFIKQYYGGMPDGPSEIMLAVPLENSHTIEEFLKQVWGRKVTLTVPKKGEKKALLTMAKRDAGEMINHIDEREKNKAEREEKLSSQIDDVIEKARFMPDTEEWTDQETGEIISLKPSERNLLKRVEAYDISNINGVDNVAAMVVYRGLKKDRRSYRRFRIKSLAMPDDYAAMREVIGRRVQRALEGDRGFLPLPDLILVDGGRGHVNAVVELLADMGVGIPVAGMAKDDYHRTERLVYHPMSGGGCGEFREENLKGCGMLFSYIGNIQEEVHRFAIEYHRNRRTGNAIRSVLDDIKGIGPKKRNALLAKFGSIEKISMADREQLLECPGITEKNADEILKFFIAKKGS